jgi:ergothioneine biosynthesis protein EgtB
MNTPREARGEIDSELSRKYARIRSRTRELAAPLSAEDSCVQSMPDASPTKWHLAHTTWFFETFVLEPYEPNFRPFQGVFRVLFNSYYNGVGEKHPRAQRGLLTRPSLSEVGDYRHQVDGRMQDLLRARGGDPAVQNLVALGLNHEQQHQELLLTDAKHLLSMNPLRPAYRNGGDAGVRDHARVWEPGWEAFDGGVVTIGYRGTGFSFDNESPCHEALLRPYRMATRLVTNAEYLQFVEQGGYANPQLWLSEGWDWIRQNRIEQPIYWHREPDNWMEFTLSGSGPLDPGRPVVHVSYFEADAYARWAGARLPTEAEWEHAAGQRALEGNFADSGIFHPCAAVPLTGKGLCQMFGDAWEWTQSSYAPYPGFRAAEGAIGEYNGKFMINQYVLRGGSCATPSDHIRPTYRNFFPTGARWQFSGIRLARDGSAA